METLSGQEDGRFSKVWSDLKADAFFGLTWQCSEMCKAKMAENVWQVLSAHNWRRVNTGTANSMKKYGYLARNDFANDILNDFRPWKAAAMILWEEMDRRSLHL